jgi:hypothetical protein
MRWRHLGGGLQGVAGRTLFHIRVGGRWTTSRIQSSCSKSKGSAPLLEEKFMAYGIHFMNTTDVATEVHCDAWPAHFERSVPPNGGTGTPLVPPLMSVKRVWVISYYSSSDGQLLVERGAISVENGSQLCTLNFKEDNYTIEFTDL